MSNKEVQLDEMLMKDNQLHPKNERIGFGRRLGAYMLDVLIVMIFGTIVGLLIGDQLYPLFFGKQMGEFNQLSEQLGGKFTVFFQKMMEITSGISVTGLILFILEGAFGQSFGKWVLKIINTNVDGNPASPSQLWLRSFLKYGASILSLIGGYSGIIYIGWIGSLWSFVIFIGFFLVFTDNKQTIHDMLAKTVVSRKK